MFKTKFINNVNLNDSTACYTLSNGVKIPVIGFGTWQVKDGNEAYQSVLTALKFGYRHIDTAEAYGNEESVGKAIKDSGIERKKIFITSKLSNQITNYDEAKKAIEISLQKLGTDYIDLFLIHWPNPIKTRSDYVKRNREVYRAMEEAYKTGKIKALGVSNFRPHHLDALLLSAKVQPTVNQLFINPSDMEEDVVAYNERHNILTEAYSPLGTGKIIHLNELVPLANKYHKSVGQIILRWSLEHGYLPLPKSVTPSRIKENREIFDFTLAQSDIEFIDSLHGLAGLAHNPDETNF